MQNEKVAIGKNVEGYLDRLTKGKEYIVIKENEKNNMVRTICDNGRAQWFSSLCFELDGNPVLTLLNWEYDDKVDDDDNKDDIDKVLRYLDACDELIEASLPLDGGCSDDNV